MGDLDSVRVAIRIRPFVKYEIERNCNEAVQKVPGQPQVKVNDTDSFTFNYVFDGKESQENVYKTCVSSMLDKLFEGFNATILAYGQTGSGKTFTMGTHFEGELNENVGVIPRAMLDIFERIEKLAGETDFNVKCSFMELYQEQLFDLLSNKGRNESIVDMREDRTGIIIPGLTEETVTTAKQTTDFLVKGSAGRAVAATAMNEQSSRSHAIFTVTLQATKKNDINSVTTSKFHLVDLAGSERSKKTKASGDRFKEGIKINQGLMVLGKVISALGTGQGGGFVCYRDSKLTRFLQDSLGGNSYTLMIACVSPANYNVDETLSTLRYADNARKIKNKPIVNQDPRMAEINFLKELNRRLRLECLAAGVNLSEALASDLAKVGPLAQKNSSTANANLNACASVGSAVNTEQVKALQDKLNCCQQKCTQLQQQLQIAFHDMAETELKAHLTEAAHEQLQMKWDVIQSNINDLKEKYVEDEKIMELHNIINDVNEEFQKSQTEISEYKKRDSAGSQMSEFETNESYPSLQEETEAHTKKQAAIMEQMRRVERELNLKQELQGRVHYNLTKFCSMDQEAEKEKVKEFEKKILDLETEKTELLEKLKNVKDNVSAKLAEERRKRLQSLEHEINEMKRKMNHQAKLLKVREKEAEKIKILNSEIRTMKEAKVKLIRAMRQESDYFRQWKMAREKEMIQLKNKDRKLQTEMAKKEALHTKQRNVLKRKCEEAMAANKRLKDALERQSAAQAQRQKSQALKPSATSNSSSNLDHVLQTAERELEIITSIVDAKFSLEQLIEDRDIITKRINELEKSEDPDQLQELASLKEEREIRGIQISDLQQKVSHADLDSRIRSLIDSVQNVTEFKVVLRHLLKSLCDLRMEYAQENQSLTSALEEHKTQMEEVQENYAQSTKKIRLMQVEYEEQLLERENVYEEKIAVLLRELQNVQHLMASGANLTPDQEERLKIQEEQLNKMESLKEELEFYKNLVAELKAAAQNVTKSKKSTAVKEAIVEIEEDEIFESEKEFEDSDDSDDPDWSKPPKKKYSRTNTKSSLSNSNSMNETYATATSTVGNNTVVVEKKSNGLCRCTGKCVSKRCGCFAKGEKCSNTCKCGPKCVNKTSDHKENLAPQPSTETTSPDSKENSPTSHLTNGNALKTTPIKAEPSEENLSETLAMKVGTPRFDEKDGELSLKYKKLSTVPFNTASVKKRFFK